MIAVCALSGCGSAGPTSNQDVANAAGELNKQVAGVEPQPDPAVVNINGSGTAPATTTAPKPGANKR